MFNYNIRAHKPSPEKIEMKKWGNLMKLSFVNCQKKIGEVAPLRLLPISLAPLSTAKVMFSSDNFKFF